MKKIIFLILFLGSFLSAQQKYLVSPNQELIPITKHDKIRDIIAKHNSRSLSSSSADCTAIFSPRHGASLPRPGSIFGPSPARSEFSSRSSSFSFVLLR